MDGAELNGDSEIGAHTHRQHLQAVALGEPARLLGALIVSRFRLAAEARFQVSEDERKLLTNSLASVMSSHGRRMACTFLSYEAAL